MNFNLLKALVEAIDARLDKLDLDCEACPDAYGWGFGTSARLFAEWDS